MSLYSWFEESLETQSMADDILAKFVPAHVNMFYCFGGIVLTTFILQAASGFGLTLYYSPTVAEAFSSVHFIVSEVNIGWLLSSIHSWSSSLMVLSLVLHMSSVYLTGGFKKPSELTWISGVLLAMLTVSFGVTGYSLPWDQVGYWAAKMVTSVPEALNDLLNGVGTSVVMLLSGGFSVGQATLSSFYAIHTLTLPVILLVVLLLHFILLRKQGMSGPL